MSLMKQSGEYDFSRLRSLFNSDDLSKNFTEMNHLLPYNIIQNEPTFKRTFAVERQDWTNLQYESGTKSYNLEEFKQKTHTKGLLIVKKGKIVYETYAKEFNVFTKFTSWSIIKSFISVLIGIAVSEGQIARISDPVTKYLPALIGSGYDAEVTIQQVLQMSSGVRFNEDYADPNSEVNRLVDVFVSQEQSLDDYVATLPKKDKPGTYAYKSVDTQVLGMILKQATGMLVSKYMQEKLWKPLGMEADAYLNKELHGNEITLAMLNATLRDYAKLGVLMLHEGRASGKQIVPASWLQKSVVPGRCDLQPGQGNRFFGYGFQWWIPKGAEFGQEFSANGIYGQYIYINKMKNVVIVKMSADPNFDQNVVETFTAFRAIANYLLVI